MGDSTSSALGLLRWFIASLVLVGSQLLIWFWWLRYRATVPWILFGVALSLLAAALAVAVRTKWTVMVTYALLAGLVGFGLVVSTALLVNPDISCWTTLLVWAQGIGFCLLAGIILHLLPSNLQFPNAV